MNRCFVPRHPAAARPAKASAKATGGAGPSTSPTRTRSTSGRAGVAGVVAAALAAAGLAQVPASELAAAGLASPGVPAAGLAAGGELFIVVARAAAPPPADASWAPAPRLVGAAWAVDDTVRARSAADRPAAPANPPGQGSAEKRILAARVAATAPLVDGDLEEGVWTGARWVSDFLQKEPNQGAPPSVRTEVAFLYDEQELYVAARLASRDSAAVGRIVTRRDDHGNSERILVSLDSQHDRRTAYTFGVTASGVRLDWFHPQDEEEPVDDTFNPVWTARTAPAAGGWTAELRIPFSQLRFSGAPDQLWGVNVKRVIPARNEVVYWVYVPRDEAGWASRFGELEGIAQIPSARRLEVVPYVAGDARLRSGAFVDDDNPLEDAREMNGRSGVDLKVGLGSNLTLDATVNPDFGQVEADPAQVNLSAQEVFFDERRPFFTEGGRLLGAQLYAEGQAGDPPPWFYSRRIGAPPHGTAEGDFVEIPQQITILGAVKLTGRLASGFSLGVLGAVTQAEKARTFDLVSKEVGRVEVEPLTGFGIGRLERQFGSSGSTVALMLTGVRRSLEEKGPMAALLTEQALAGGADWNLRFAGGAYDLKGHLGFSHVAGDAAAIERIQRSSVHYFQRPDDHIEFDPTRTSLSGATAMLRFRKVSGGHLRGEAGMWVDSPGLEFNDAGRIGRADDIANWGHIRWREETPRGALRNWEVGLHGFGNHNFGGLRRFTKGFVRTRATWSNFWEALLDVAYAPPWTSDDLTRGGPAVPMGQGWDVYAELKSNQQSRTRWSTDVFYRDNSFGGVGTFVNGEVSTQPSSRLRLTVSPHWSRSTNPRQYLATLDGGPEDTFGQRYVFSFVDQSEISAQFRVNYGFTPDLGLEVYADPFASSGRFYDFRELREAGSDEFLRYGKDEGTTLARDEDGGVVVSAGGDAFTLTNPDFNVRSLRSSVLLRWEWQPGSTLFLVWQGNRASSRSDGRSVGLDSLGDAFGADGEDILALKITYWLPIG